MKKSRAQQKCYEDHSEIIPYLHILIMLCIASITVYSSLDCIRLFSHITATVVLQFLLYAIKSVFTMLETHKGFGDTIIFLYVCMYVCM